MSSIIFALSVLLESANVWTNHLFLVASYWIGWPDSPGFLSETRLTMVNLSLVLATVLIKIGSAKSAFVLDDAILISVAASSESLPPAATPVIT